MPVVALLYGGIDLVKTMIVLGKEFNGSCLLKISSDFLLLLQFSNDWRDGPEHCERVPNGAVCPLSVLRRPL